MKKLGAGGFAHWIVAAAVLVVIGGVGGYIYLQQSHADAVYPTASRCGAGYVKKGADYALSRSNGGLNDLLDPSSVSYVRLYVNTQLKRACAFTVASGSANGLPKKPMTVHIGIEQSQPPLTVVKIGGSSTGTFASYAGPVYVNYGSFYSSSYKILVTGTMQYNGSMYSGQGNYSIR